MQPKNPLLLKEGKAARSADGVVASNPEQTTPSASRPPLLQKEGIWITLHFAFSF
jgi:hypothetical protein